MMLVGGGLSVALATTHMALRDVPAAITQASLEQTLRIVHAEMQRKYAIAEPRILVAGLNPHAGEHGLFGREEIEEIQPAVEWARGQGMPVEGPIPPDTVFYLAVRRKRYDAIVCMYHDQGHIPLKLLDFEGGVNIALGLPIVRTSVDHGTAFDIAGQGVAQTASFIHALEYAVRLTRT